ncbi:MAG TPA: menaquinone biosynthesis protein [Pedobacter sp.]
MSKIRVSAVSYTNTKPFIYGLEHSGILDSIELSLDNPSECAQKLIDDKADIGLVPVAALPSIDNYQILSNYCIGANGAVDSVFIFSSKPVEKIRTIRLDPQSRTSNALAAILMKEHWKTNVQFIVSGDADAYVEIGDRTFGKRDLVPYSYDLAQSWKDFTGLSFAFAVWASNKPMEPNFIVKFNSALELGVHNRNAVIKELSQQSDFDFEDYLINKVDYSFNDQKKQSLKIFLDYLSEINK